MDKDREKQVVAHIHEMLEPWIKKGEEENYFRVRIYIGNGGDPLFTKGLLMSGSRDAKDKVAFEKSFLHESTQSVYRTINCKPLEELSLNDLQVLEEAVGNYIKRDCICPAVIRDYYSDTISSENDWFSSVDFGRPVDGEMYEANEFIEARDKNEAILPDFDQAIYYAEKVSLALERRGQHWNFGDHLWHVTVESDDPRIPEMVKEYDGIATFTDEEDIPLTMATFKASAPARRYAEHVNRMLDTELFRNSPQYRLESYLSDRLKDADNKIVLASPMTLHYHNTRYHDVGIRNVREIYRHTDKRFAIQGVGDVTNIVVANKSGNYVNIADLTDVSNRVLLSQILRQDAKQAIHDRIVTPSARSFTSDQIDVLNRYHQVAAPDNPAGEVFKELLDEVSQEPDVSRKPEKWKTDTLRELNDLAEGITREERQELKI